LLTRAMIRNRRVAGSRMFLDFEKPRKSVTTPRTDNNIMGYIF
jgi:hypothetical protein